MKRLVVLAVMALAFLATGAKNRAENPMPQCDPCPFVR
jgi:hypothetical protein